MDAHRELDARVWAILKIVRGATHAVLFVIVLTGAPMTAADDVQLSFRDGRVTVIATDVPVRTILEEWSRVGETEFIDADQLTGQPVRLQIVDVPEADALRILLRHAAGYVAAPRFGRTRDQSRFNRVLVMATSRPPAASSYGVTLGSAASGAVPAQRDPTISIQDYDSEPSLEEFDSDELEELRQILPQPFSLDDRSAQPDDGRSQDTTAPRPGIVVAPSDDQPPVFIRRPVRPQAPDPPRQ